MKTALYPAHVALGAKMVEFAGWEMPLQYQGIIPEHHAVRQHVGLFDISHMGRVVVEGPDAEAFLDYASTNIIAAKPEGSGTYTVLCNASGGCVDDVIVYKQDAQHFFLAVNASNRQQDLTHLKQISQPFNVTIRDRYKEEGILAIQGPEALPVVTKLFPEAAAIGHMHFVMTTYEGKELILSNSGYTGAGGFEIFASHDTIVALWHSLLREGKEFGIVPVGLGARDTLRLEMGYALYGHEISEEIAPNESVASWTVKWNKPDFIGKSSLEELEKNGRKRHEYGVVLIDPGVARAGYAVLLDGKAIGTVTSGTHSPTLNQAIAIVLVDRPLQVGDLVEVQIRQHTASAKIVKLPFI